MAVKKESIGYVSMDILLKARFIIASAMAVRIALDINSLTKIAFLSPIQNYVKNGIMTKTQNLFQRM